MTPRQASGDVVGQARHDDASETGHAPQPANGLRASPTFSKGPRTARLRKGETVDRPVGGAAFLAALETRSGRRLAPLKRGPKPRGAEMD
jgi:hypothetical protein